MMALGSFIQRVETPTVFAGPERFIEDLGKAGAPEI